MLKALRLWFVAFVAVFLLTSCREELYTNLSERDANEMLQTLLVRGVDAKKENAGKKGFTITVEREELLRALEIVKEQSLPRSAFENLGSVFSGQGMISSQTEEQSRLAFAISQELSETFSKIDGVLDSRVHVVLVHHEQASGLTTPPSAAVFIRHTRNSPVINMVSGIKDTVARAVPGLNFDRVSVMLEQSSEQVISPKIKQAPWYSYWWAYVIAILSLALCATGSVCGYIYYQKKKNSKEGN
ncbi:MAG: type III secretion system inner membrane ring lipoprotein SctJ [Succinivibrio sp.]